MMEDQPVRASTPKRTKLDETVIIDSGDDSELLFITSEDENDSRFLDTTNNEEVLCLSSDSSEDDSRFIYDSSQHELSKGSGSILFLDSTDGMNDTKISSDDVSDTECVSKPCSKKVVECCKNKCLESFSIKEFNSATKHFQSKSTIEQRQYLLDSIILTSPGGASTSTSVQENFMLYGKPVCKAAFALLLGTSERRLERIKQNVAVGKITHGNRGVKRPSNKKVDASAWMNDYFLTMGDHMPDSNRIHLPSFLTKREVYQKMCADLTKVGIKEIISLSTFYELWEKEYSHVLIPEVSRLHASYL